MNLQDNKTELINMKKTIKMHIFVVFFIKSNMLFGQYDSLRAYINRNLTLSLNSVEAWSILPALSNREDKKIYLEELQKINIADRQLYIRKIKQAFAYCSEDRDLMDSYLLPFIDKSLEGCNVEDFDYLCDYLLDLKRKNINQTVIDKLTIRKKAIGYASIDGFNYYYLLSAYYNDTKPTTLAIIRKELILEDEPHLYLSWIHAAVASRAGGRKEQTHLMRIANEMVTDTIGMDIDGNRLIKYLGFSRNRESIQFLIDTYLDNNEVKFYLKTKIVHRLSSILKDFPIKYESNLYIGKKEAEIATKWLRRHRKNFIITDEYLF